MKLRHENCEYAEKTSLTTLRKVSGIFQKRKCCVINASNLKNQSKKQFTFIKFSAQEWLQIEPRDRKVHRNVWVYLIYLLYTTVCYRDFGHWDMSYQNTCVLISYQNTCRYIYSHFKTIDLNLSLEISRHSLFNQLHFTQLPVWRDQEQQDHLHVRLLAQGCRIWCYNLQSATVKTRRET